MFHVGGWSADFRAAGVDCGDNYNGSVVGRCARSGSRVVGGGYDDDRAIVDDDGIVVVEVVVDVAGGGSVMFGRCE